ncbi:MAG: nucleotide exchange factor GrpE [Vallitaleaceae bacterium]|jgi:molecular chaperone GrpE (heat shock protein)|nr:nucleotide exchange factor GrpE [Vallitaleaceae bacterium]
MNYFVNEQTLEQAKISELLYQTDYEAVCNHLIVTQHEQLIERISSKLKVTYEEENQLKPMEDLFEFFEILKRMYFDYIGYLSDHADAITHMHIKEIMMGIKDMFLMDLDGFLSIEHDNASAEAESLINKAKDNLERQMNMRTMYLKKVDFVDFIDFNYTKEVMKDVIGNICHDTILIGMKVNDNFIEAINNIDKRPEIRKYIDFLHKQDKTIAILNLIQMKVIHQEIPQLDQRAILEELASMIKVIYNLIGHKVREITSYLESIEVHLVSEQVIQEMIEENTQMIYEQVVSQPEYLGAYEIYIENRNSLIKNMFTQMNDEMEKANDLSIKNLFKESKDVQLISCKITESVKNLDSSMKKILAYCKPEEPYTPIVGAITETIMLKLEALKEKDYEYMLQRQNKMVQSEKQFYDYINDIKDHFEDYFHQMLNDSAQVFIGLQDDYIRLFQDVLGSIKKADIDYLKYNLLFEVVTLEEIVTYSLPKLRAYEHALSKQVISLVSSTYEEISSILKRFNIAMIEAIPGEKFNGKIHEVTVVEPNETYGKGKIIRMETKGYIYKDIPVVRAHVIVAN